MTVKPQWKAVALNETHYWNIVEHHKPFIEKILSVYFFDATARIFCCELTPSHFMIGLSHTVVIKGEPNEDILQEIYNTYETEYPEDCYIHCSNVKQFKDVVEYGPIETDDEDDDGEDEVREFWQGNPPF